MNDLTYSSPIPGRLLDSLRTEGKDAKPLVIFCGAGVSAIRPTSLPDWPTMLRRLLKRCRKEMPNEKNKWKRVSNSIGQGHFLGAQTLISDALEAIVMRDFLTEALGGKVSFQANAVHQAIVDLAPKGIITTNFDTCFQQILQKCHRKYLSGRAVSNFAQGFQIDKCDDFFWTLHGSLDEKSQSKILAFGRDGYEMIYSESGQTKSPVREILEDAFKRGTVLFVGYSYSDPDLAWMLRKGFAYLPENNRPFILAVKHPKETGDDFCRTIERLEAEGFDVLTHWDRDGLSKFADRLIRAKRLIEPSLGSFPFEHGFGEIEIQYETIDDSSKVYDKSADWLFEVWKNGEHRLGFSGYDPVLEVGAGSGISSRVFLEKDDNLGRHRDFVVIDRNYDLRPFRQYRLGEIDSTRKKVEDHLRCVEEIERWPQEMKEAAKRFKNQAASKRSFQFRIDDKERGIDVRLARSHLSTYLGKFGTVLFASSMHWTMAEGGEVTWNLGPLLHEDALGKLLAKKCLLVWNASAVQFNFGNELAPKELIDELKSKHSIELPSSAKLNELKFTEPKSFKRYYNLPDLPHELFLKELMETINRDRTKIERLATTEPLWKEDLFRNMYTEGSVRKVVGKSGFKLLNWENGKPYRLNWLPLNRTQMIDIFYGIGGFMRYFNHVKTREIKAEHRYRYLKEAVQNTNEILEDKVKQDDILGCEFFATFAAYRD